MLGATPGGALQIGELAQRSDRVSVRPVGQRGERLAQQRTGLIEAALPPERASPAYCGPGRVAGSAMALVRLRGAAVSSVSGGEVASDRRRFARPFVQRGRRQRVVSRLRVVIQRSRGGEA